MITHVTIVNNKWELQKQEFVTKNMVSAEREASLPLFNKI